MADYEIVALHPAMADRVTKPGLATTAVRETRFHSKTWLPTEIDTLRRTVTAGDCWEDIATCLSRSIPAVQSMAWEIGVSRGPVRRWTEDEDGALRREYGLVPTSVLAIRLDRTSTAIYARAGYLGLTRDAAPPYSAEEDALLQCLFEAGTPIAGIAARLGRPGSGVTSRAGKLRLRHPDGSRPWGVDEQARALALAEAGHRYSAIRTMLADEGFPARSARGFQAFIRSSGYARGWGRPWIAEEIDMLRTAYGNGDNLIALAHRLGRSKYSIRWKAHDLGLSGTHPKPDGARQGRPWTTADDQILRANYGKAAMKTRDLAVLLDRPIAAVYNRAFLLGLDHGYFKAWTAEDDLIVRIAYRAGISITDVAGVLERDVAIVSKHAIALGIPFASRPKQAPRTPRASRLPVSRARILAIGLSAEASPTR